MVQELIAAKMKSNKVIRVFIVFLNEAKRSSPEKSGAYRHLIRDSCGNPYRLTE